MPFTATTRTPLSTIQASSASENRSTKAGGCAHATEPGHPFHRGPDKRGRGGKGECDFGHRRSGNVTDRVGSGRGSQRCGDCSAGAPGIRPEAEGPRRSRQRRWRWIRPSLCWRTPPSRPRRRAGLLICACARIRSCPPVSRCFPSSRTGIGGLLPILRKPVADGKGRQSGRRFGGGDLLQGAAPLSRLEDHRLASPWNRVGGFVRDRGEGFYHFEGLCSFKRKG